MHEGLISRTALAAQLHVRPATIAKSTRLGWFPQPTVRISERVILYEFVAVQAACEHAAASGSPRRGRRRTYGSRELDLAYRDRRRTRRAITEHRA